MRVIRIIRVTRVMRIIGVRVIRLIIKWLDLLGVLWLSGDSRLF